MSPPFSLVFSVQGQPAMRDAGLLAKLAMHAEGGFTVIACGAGQGAGC